MSEYRGSSRVTGFILSLELLLLVAAAVLLLAAVREGALELPVFDGVRGALKLDSITKGPALLRVYKDRAAIMWESSTEGPWKVYFGDAGGLDRYIESTPQQVEYEFENDAKQIVKKTAFIHKVWIESLRPAQEYCYRVAGPWLRGKTHRFKTADAESDEVRFLVYGDSRTRPETHRKLVELMIREKVDFIVHTGDLVSSGNKYEQWGPQFFEPLKGLMESVPVYIVKGNHEGDNGNYEKLLIPGGEENSFGFDYGPVHFFCLDNVSKGKKTKERLNKIVADAKSSGAAWKFVSYHVPSVNFGGHRSKWAAPAALPALAEAGADFVLAGHSHQYERFRPVSPPSGSNASFVSYITTGGGGASLYGIEPTIYHASTKQIHHYCRFHIKGDKLTMDAIDIDGNVIDHVEITKTEGRPDKQYLWTAIPMGGITLHQTLRPALEKPLSAKPAKNQPFVISYKLSVSELASPAMITLALRCRDRAYELPEAKTLTIPKEGGTLEVELTATPLVDVELSDKRQGNGRPIVPALWLDCHYEIERVSESITLPIVVKDN
ncbi:MAG: metallophosphoesterase [Phycisphaerales bacterium]|nr:MAG: metallophosphoesterase [Phycisphaerales bacterium]